jgi:hypothetical protein
MIGFIDIYKGLSYRVYWNYYGYHAKGPANPITIAPIANPDFNRSTATFAFRYAFEPFGLPVSRPRDICFTIFTRRMR